MAIHTAHVIMDTRASVVIEVITTSYAIHSTHGHAAELSARDGCDHGPAMLPTQQEVAVSS